MAGSLTLGAYPRVAQLATILFVLTQAAACSDGGGDPAPGIRADAGEEPGPDGGGQENRPPAFSSSPPSRVMVGALLRYEPTVEDPDGDPVSLELTEAPPGARLDAEALVWDAPDSPGGSATFALEATDGRSYEPSGKLSTMTSPDGVVTRFEHDGPLVTAIQHSGLFSHRLEWTYDARMMVASEQLDSGAPFAFAFDADGLLTRAGPLQLDYRPMSGLPLSDTIDNTTETWTYNAYGEVVRRSVSRGPQVEYDLTGQVDALGRLVEETFVRGGQSVSRSYRYRANGELERVEESGGRVFVYGYDADGNRTVVAVDGRTTSATFDTRSRPVSFDSWSFEYDELGRLSSRSRGSERWFYQHDFKGYLKEVVNGGGQSIRYRIDGAGRRVQRVSGSRATTYLYRGDQIAYLVAPDGTLTRFLYSHHPNVPSAMERGGRWYRIISDFRGSVRAVIDASTGVVAQEMDYGPFGEVERDTNPGFQPFGFAGGLYDAEAGLVHFGAREYLPGAALWLEPDPMGFAAGDASLYRHVFNDPVNLTDPTGQIAFAPILAGAFLAYRVTSGALTLLDLMNAAKQLMDPCASGADKLQLLAEMFGEAAAGFILGKGLSSAFKKGKGLIDRFLRGCRNSFVAGTLVSTGTGMVPIETIEVGQRVTTPSSGDATWIDSDWLVVRLSTDEERPHRITLLRPPEWLEELELAVGVRVPYLLGDQWVSATMVSVESFAGPSPGPGRVVLSTIEGSSESIYSVELVGQEAPLLGTGGHLVRSVDRSDWVQLRQLRAGEHVETLDGPVEVAGVAWVPGSFPVFDFEVEIDQEYFAGGVRVHNCTPSEAQRKLRRGSVPPAVRREVDRIDRPHTEHGQWHAHDKKGGAVNQDGSIKEGNPSFSRSVRNWLSEHGWAL